MNLAVIIPTWKAESHWEELHSSLVAQGLSPDQVLIIDSSSPDRTLELAGNSGYRTARIEQSAFGHGRTRQEAIAFFPTAEFLLYMTQDAVLDKPDSISRLLETLRDPAVGAAYGRQLPRPQAGAIERHARFFSYPAESHVSTLESRHTIGLRAAFCSNSFAVYRRSALESVGGFPRNVIFAEDSYVAAKMLAAHWKIAYNAEATVVHSHEFTLRQESARYFDIGVHHARESWLLKEFGSAGGEGAKFVRSELSYLFSHEITAVPIAILRTAVKLLSYRLGRMHSRLPSSWRKALSSNPSFWNERATSQTSK